MHWDALLSDSEMIAKKVCGFLSSFPIPKGNVVDKVHPAPKCMANNFFDC